MRILDEEPLASNELINFEEASYVQIMDCIIEGNIANTVISISQSSAIDVQIFDMHCKRNVGGCVTLMDMDITGTFTLTRLQVEYNTGVGYFDEPPILFEGVNSKTPAVIYNCTFRHNFFKGKFGGAFSFSRSTYFYVNMNEMEFFNNT